MIRRTWLWLGIAIALALSMVMAVLSGGGNAGGRVAKYLRRRDAAERKAKAAADSALEKSNSDVAKANEEIRNDSLTTADSINRAGRAGPR